MKKFILGAAALTLLFAACKKDDKSGNNNNVRIVGTWKPTTQVTKNSINGTPQSPVTVTRNAGDWMQFTADGIAYSHYFLNNTKWIDDTSAYSINGNLLRFIAGTDTADATILTLTSSQLVIKNTETYIWAGDTTVEETTTTLSR
jgi:hypothetical protein